MTSVFQLTAAAENDLITIWRYIAQESPHAADALLERLQEKFSLLAEFPFLGQLRPDIASEMRYFPYGNYLILYRNVENTLQIVRVVHGARFLPAM